MKQETTILSRPGHEGGYVLLENISWETYEALLGDLGEHPGKRIFYDHGLLEIMTLSPEHEWIKRLIGRFIELLTLELNIDIRSVGSTTWKRKILKRGFEPDECYYIANEEVVRGKGKIDIDKDPVPDLVVECDISRSSLNREGIYSAFGISEVWRFDGKKVHFFELMENGSYVKTDTSAAFPFLTSVDLNRFLDMRIAMSETRLMQAFQKWVRQTLGSSRRQ
ncbi:MAG: Uma2 family endonuclease [Planctomycetes bacterium]|nr:Uma2 family endonuclease [Planctomycetota bacterium]